MRTRKFFFALSLTVFCTASSAHAQARLVGYCDSGSGPAMFLDGTRLQMGVYRFAQLLNEVLEADGYIGIPGSDWTDLEEVAIDDYGWGILREASYEIYGDYYLRAGEIWELYMTWEGFNWYLMIWVTGEPGSLSDDAQWYVWRKRVPPLLRRR